MLSRLANGASRRALTANILPSLTRVEGTPVRLRANSTLTKGPLSALHYHFVKAPPGLQHWSKSVFAVSYLPDPPLTVEGSKTILGVIPAIEGGQGLGEPGLNDFKENFWRDLTYKIWYVMCMHLLLLDYEASFLDLMHNVVRAVLVEGADAGIQAEATQRGSGWLHIQDERNVPALGRIGDPDDILGSVRVEDGKILADTYQKMPSYRLFTADGPPKLSEGLAKRLEEALLQQQKIENSI